MKLTEIMNWLFLRTGQYIVGDITKLKLDIPSFWPLVEQELIDYARYFPVTKRFNIQASNLPPSFSFEIHSSNSGYIDAENPGLPPVWFSRCVPVSYGQQLNNWFNNVFYVTQGNLGTGTLKQPRKFWTDYLNGVLYFTEPGTFDVTAHYDYANISIFDEDVDDLLIDIDIPDLQKNKIFLELIAGRFLEMIGRSRRAFTRTDFPVIMDSDKLVVEGERIYKDAIKDMIDRHDYSISIHA